MQLYLNLVFDVTRAYICVCVQCYHSLHPPSVSDLVIMSSFHIFYIQGPWVNTWLGSLPGMPSRLVNCVQELTNLQVKSNFRFFFKSSEILWSSPAYSRLFMNSLWHLRTFCAQFTQSYCIG